MSSRRTRQKSFLKKVLEYFTIGDEPVRKEGYSVDMDFYTVKNFLAKENAEQFLSILRRHGPAFTPKYWQHMDHDRLMKLDLEDLEGPIEMWTRDHFWLLHTRDQNSFAQASPYSRGYYANLSVTIKEQRLVKYSVSADHLLSIALDLYEFWKPFYGRVRRRPPPITKTRILYTVKSYFDPPIENSIADVCWANFFGTPYVEMIGEGRIRTAPCERVEELPDGGLLLLLTPTLPEAYSRRGRKLAEMVKDHLGREYFYHKSDGEDYVNLRQRPVPSLDLSELPGEPPTHEVQVEDPYTQYIPDTQAFIRSVPQLIEALRDRIGKAGSRLDCSRESLKIVDEYLMDTYSETEISDAEELPELVCELTAYLGEVVRQMFKGEWKSEILDYAGMAAVVRFGTKKHERFDPLKIVEEIIPEVDAESGTLLESELESWWFAQTWFKPPD